MCRPYRRGPVKGSAGGSADIMGSVYSTLFLDVLKPGKFH